MIQGNWSVQVIPLQDLKEHSTSFPEDCKCIVKIDIETGAIIHKAFDKRQEYEEQELL